MKLNPEKWRRKRKDIIKIRAEIAENKIDKSQQSQKLAFIRTKYFLNCQTEIRKREREKQRMNERTRNVLPISGMKKDITTYPIDFENIMNNSMSVNDMRWSNSEENTTY